MLTTSRYSVLPAISLDGVLHLDILTCSWTAAEFCSFVDVLRGNTKLWAGHSLKNG